MVTVVLLLVVALVLALLAVSLLFGWVVYRELHALMAEVHSLIGRVAEAAEAAVETAVAAEAQARRTRQAVKNQDSTLRLALSALGFRVPPESDGTGEGEPDLDHDEERASR